VPDTSAGPRRDGGVTAACVHRGAAMPPGRARRYCSPACRQAGYRRRASAARPAPPPLPAGRTRASAGICQCPGCGEKLAGERRCPDCSLFARRIGDGGSCPGRGEILTITELTDIG